MSCIPQGCADTNTSGARAVSRSIQETNPLNPEGHPPALEKTHLQTAHQRCLAPTARETTLSA